MKLVSLQLQIALCAILFSSCDKEEPGPIQLQAGEYYETGIEEAGSIRVFTQAGEIKTASIISRFDLEYSEDLAWKIENLLYLKDTIIVYGSERAALKGEGSLRNYDITSTGSILKFTSADILQSYSYNEVYTKRLDYNMSLHKPIVVNEFLISSVGGYEFGYNHHPQIILTKESGKLKAPLIIFFLHHNWNWHNNVQNKLDPHFYKMLLPGDTVVLREHMMLYEN